MGGMVPVLSSASNAQQDAVNFVENQNHVNYSLFLSVYFLAVLDGFITISAKIELFCTSSFCLLSTLVLKRIKLRLLLEANLSSKYPLLN